MMRLTIIGIALLMSSFFAHLALWRVRMPQRPIIALLGIFAAFPVLAVSAAAAAGMLSTLALHESLRVAIFYTSCSLVYVAVYSAIEVQSPTLAIVSYVAARGNAGCSDAEIAGFLMAGDSLAERLHLMEAGAAISISADQCRLTPSGLFWARLFEHASGLFGLPLGG
jgi:hypothetical protein